MKGKPLPSILSFFRNQLIEFDNTGTLLLDTVHHRTLNLFLNHFCLRENVKILSYICDIVMGVVSFCESAFEPNLKLMTICQCYMKKMSFYYHCLWHLIFIQYSKTCL